MTGICTCTFISKGQAEGIFISNGQVVGECMSTCIISNGQARNIIYEFYKLFLSSSNLLWHTCQVLF